MELVCAFKKVYVLLPYITYVTQSGRFSQCPAFLSRMAKERDKKYSVKIKKKIMSRSFLNSGTLIVILDLRVYLRF
jgi:hypothetical protein